MKALIYTLISTLLMIGLLTGCDQDPPQEQTDDEATVEEEESAASDDDGEVIAEEGDDRVELEGGQWVESELYGVKIRVPDDWEIGRSDDAVTAVDPERTTTVLLAGSESENTLQTAITRLRSDLRFTDVHLESSDMTTVEGFPGTRGRGSAVLVHEDAIDEEIQFLGYALRVGDRNVTILIFSEATMYEAKRDLIDGIAHTITRL